MSAVDHLEGHPELYTRTDIMVELGDTIQPVQGYLMHNYHPDLLKLKRLDKYTNIGNVEKPYVKPTQRDMQSGEDYLNILHSVLKADKS